MKILLLIFLLFVAGCAVVEIKKPDGTNVFVAVVGSSDLTDLAYFRDANGINLVIGTATNNPDGVGEVVGEAARVGVGL